MTVKGCPFARHDRIWRLLLEGRGRWIIALVLSLARDGGEWSGSRPGHCTAEKRARGTPPIVGFVCV